ncbi:hypothetical protein B0E38_04721 [Streptomyces sp. 111WW2]|uniref:hypothetical protein n=1 Tax=Streptomyces sp. 111WW2 TaxID=1945515 RepID=UPI000D0C86F3|nr:hypothetical protein [Streptomyces sp. 111WW2]PSK52395.1 hypothetical protein B0E38_04721 [Streptomyces sp. 111WW2]
MPERTIVASVSGAAVGVMVTIALTGGVPDDEWLRDGVMLAAWFFGMICVALASSAGMRTWLARHDVHNRTALDEIARQRTALIEASAIRGAELKEREDRLNKQAELAGDHVMSLASRLDEALTRNAFLERQLTDRRRQYEDLARDHNALIRDILQERSDRFARRAGPSTARPTASTPPAAPADSDSPVRPYADPGAGHAPVTPIPLRIPAPTAPHLVTDQPQHDRPAEGVRGPA